MSQENVEIVRRFYEAMRFAAMTPGPGMSRS